MIISPFHLIKLSLDAQRNLRGPNWTFTKIKNIETFHENFFFKDYIAIPQFVVNFYFCLPKIETCSNLILLHFEIKLEFLINLITNFCFFHLNLIIKNAREIKRN